MCNLQRRWQRTRILIEIRPPPPQLRIDDGGYPARRRTPPNRENVFTKLSPIDLERILNARPPRLQQHQCRGVPAHLRHPSSIRTLTSRGERQRPDAMTIKHLPRQSHPTVQLEIVGDKVVRVRE